MPSQHHTPVQNDWPPTASAVLHCHGADVSLVGRITRSVLADAGMPVDHLERAVGDVRKVCSDPTLHHEALACEFFERPGAVLLVMVAAGHTHHFEWESGSSK